MKKAQQTCLVIAGMYHSGASTLAGIISILSDASSKASRESGGPRLVAQWPNEQVIEVSDKVLASAGTAWDDIMPREANWLEAKAIGRFETQGAKLYKTELQDAALHILEEPRIGRALPFWLKVIASKDRVPVVVLPIRAPLSVTADLASHAHVDPSFGQMLWLRYVLEGEIGSRHQKRLFCSFDDLMTSWSEVISRVQALTGYKEQRLSAKIKREVEAYLDDQKFTYDQSSPANLDGQKLVGWVQATYDVLLRWIATGENEEDYVLLDEVRGSFDAACLNFAPIMRAAQVAVSSSKISLSAVGLAPSEQRAGLVTSLLPTEIQRTSIELAQGELDNATREIASLQAELRKSKLQNQILTDQYSQLEIEQNGLHIAVSTSESALRSTQVRLEFAQQSSVAAEITMAQRLDEIEQLSRSIAILQISLDQTASKLRDAEIEKSSLLETSSSTSKRLTDALLELSELRENEKKNAGINAGLSQHVRLLLSDVDKAKLDLNTEQNNQAGLWRIIDQLQTDIASTQQAEAQAIGKVRALEDNVAQISSALLQRTAEANDLFEEVKVAQASLAAERVANQTSKATAELNPGQKARLTKLEQEITQREQKLAQCMVQIDALKASVGRQAQEHQTALQGKETAARAIVLAATRSTNQARAQLDALVLGLSEERHSFFQRKSVSIQRKASLLVKAGLIDVDWYRATYPDVAASGVDPAVHYLTAGLSEGRRLKPE
jgi:hypothetical protein